jgi:hypothetical protein
MYNYSKHFSLDESIDILERTPAILNALLVDINEEWTSANEGGETWSVYDIAGHLIHGEKTDWIPRLEIMLSEQEEKTFEPFDRFAQFEDSKGKSLAALLEEFSLLRAQNIKLLRSKKIEDKELRKTGIHPAFGQVTVEQLLSAWVVHDLNHIAQMCRVMAKYYIADVGPWIKFMGILQR